jgi:pimeloyl-ACP methyl ester carboxylesterase
MVKGAADTASATRSSSFVDLDWSGRSVRLETQRVGEPTSSHPEVVFLHEGLGSVGQWRDFPERFCRANGLRGLVYSRPGYGNSTPRAEGEQWDLDFMHRQANEVLPALLRTLGVTRPWLFGHSDGASIALLYAALAGTGAAEIAGVVALAPHVFTEDISVRSIAAVRALYLASVESIGTVDGGLKSRMARYHADPDSAFWGWNNAWLAPGFRAWNIETEIAAITCPLLVVQGEGDEYGTMEQIHRIQRAVPHARALVLADCGHSPQRDQAERVITEAGSFIIHPA